MKDFSNIRVLVIDDEPGIRLSLSAFLKDCGFNAAVAESAEEALDLMRNNTFDVCIVDLRLPGKNGEELIMEAWRHYPNQRYIIYTGSVAYTLPEELIELGMRPEYVFLKPVRTLLLLVKCIKELAASVEAG